MSVGFSYEYAAHEAGWQLVCGVDEAGAGPLCGPVYAAAVILPDGVRIPGLDDSKRLTEKKREAVFQRICDAAVSYGIAWVDAREIDDTDILSARIKAMQLAIDKLSPQPDYALVDGNRDHGRTAMLVTPHQCLVKGDALSASIAAASVLAKVSRDRFVVEVLDKQYPEYGFAQHKGYGTKLHLEMLDRYGPCPAHRRSFLKKWENRT